MILFGPYNIHRPTIKEKGSVGGLQTGSPCSNLSKNGVGLLQGMVPHGMPYFCYGMPIDLAFPNTERDLISPCTFLQHPFTPSGPTAAPTMVVDSPATGTILQAGPQEQWQCCWAERTRHYVHQSRLSKALKSKLVFCWSPKKVLLCYSAWLHGRPESAFLLSFMETNLLEEFK